MLNLLDDAEIALSHLRDIEKATKGLDMSSDKINPSPGDSMPPVTEEAKHV